MNNTNGSPFSFQVQLTGDTATPIVIANGFPTSGIYGTLNSNAIVPAQYQNHFNTPVVEKYGINLQIMPLKKTVVEVGYEGNHAYRLDESWRVNYPTPAAGDINARRPYPQWGEGFGVFFRGYSHFNALEVTVRQQPIHGLTIYSALTVEHSYGAPSSPDPYNFSYGYGMLANDYGKQWATSAIYDLPSGKSLPRLTRQVVGGWQASSIIQLRGGLPFSVASSQTMNDDINASRANLVLTNGPAVLPNDQRTINRWFNTAAFAAPANYTYGNSGLNILRGPGFAEIDFALQKTFTVGERYKATFRAEAENLLNRVNLGNPSATLGAAAFGTIRSLGGDPRYMQMVLRFAF
jgi:hypothetical protein